MFNHRAVDITLAAAADQCLIMQGTPTGGTSSERTLSSSSSCDCEREILRIANLCQHYAQVSSHDPLVSSPQRAMSPPVPSITPLTGLNVAQGANVGAPMSSFLSATLTIAFDLVQHWGTLNGCPNNESHLKPHTLSSMVDAIGLVLRGHELAVVAASTSESQQSQRATIGNLELESSESAIVVQECLKASIVRLAAMLQDIAEEAQNQSPSLHPLKDSDIKSLMTRLFVTLASVDRMVTI
ncbi:hypothetical protein F5B22DRAFT_180409 [Xylaria bambusicola]|uniref:uncharacterized protein n=1 Tax=Xylaria bambusicola TaxID=326684 RepID=UPI002008297F|nr:uncharacterized protein F5B22DRAFT_180409 [Xylaria bambusicola]KAI0516772.1 hypothetical protein F5B22DRAFT_180409 [Xylaria bambusicola]